MRSGAIYFVAAVLALTPIVAHLPRPSCRGHVRISTGKRHAPPSAPRAQEGPLDELQRDESF